MSFAENPLLIIQDAIEEADKVRAIVSRIESIIVNHVTMSGLLERIKRKHVIPNTLINDTLLREYSRFLICVWLKEAVVRDGGNLKLSPSIYIDKIWHEHILDTKSYRETNELLGTQIDHYPEGQVDPKNVKEERRLNTRAVYIALFGSDPFLLPVWKSTDEQPNTKHDFFIFVKLMDDTTRNILLRTGASVEEAKVAIEEKYGNPIDEQRLIYFNHQLEDGRLLSDYNIQSGSTIFLTNRLRGC